MEFDEQSNSGFPVALSAPGQLDVTEKGVDRSPALALEACTGARMHAPGLAKNDVDWAVFVFSLRCTQALDVRPAAPPASSSTIH